VPARARPCTPSSPACTPVHTLLTCLHARAHPPHLLARPCTPSSPACSACPRSVPSLPRSLARSLAPSAAQSPSLSTRGTSSSCDRPS
jgi:hypothetical protein